MLREEIKAIIKQNTVEIISEEELIKRLETNRPLRIKFGADPTAPDIHLGHTVILHKLRLFQDLGHQVIFIIGDFTARIGDPTGRDTTRPPLTEDQIIQNARTYQAQIFKILDPERTKVIYNSQWFNKLPLGEMIKLTSHYTIARMLERDDFSQRYLKKKEITILEFLYPLLQGYDSIRIHADVEIGGTDQKFNLLVARDLQRAYGEPPQIVITMPILEGMDGTQKMSKSYGNYIGITESPDEMFGKLMSIPDKLMLKFFDLLTEFSGADIKRQIQKGKLHPKSAKKFLSRRLVAFYHDEKSSAEAEERFERIFKEKKFPAEMPVFIPAKDSYSIIELLVESGLTSSKSEARRMIIQHGVRLNKIKIIDIDLNIDCRDTFILQVGSRKFVKVTSCTF